MTPEKHVQNAIVTYLKKLIDDGYPVYVERRQAGGFSYKKGQADLYAVIDGQHVEIEVKRPGGQRSPDQEKWEEMCRRCNIMYICADSVQVVANFLNSNFHFI